ncbi:Gfo/Idh/MocA family oxidoreductase [Plantactinospora sp. KLBMP9567]|uniref:Gfo/Idh/MocA family protein n=1 Tax=Plantactinospora sp. KLBMP9567 TaxID=3085900 RepID=UPI002980F1FD|nr:Gfo/Idh/MocA family oxidoreductase [Plantactinospora sp. KLBMP9567]MDW5329380.1 Gfo/Idh/MocA family oxidoreductase [Plantactinospora sp. KLBMP9567]
MTEKFGLIGFGYWGANLARNLDKLAGDRWRYLVDASPERRQAATERYPRVRATGDLDAVLGDDEVRAVLIATPAPSHAPLARRALAAGKHVFVEKPLATSVADAVALAETADRYGLVLMVGHTFEYVPAVERMRDYIRSGEIGDVLYLHSQRLNLGRIQNDLHTFWSIGPHDVSIANYLLGAEPCWVAAQGGRYLHDGVEDVTFVTVGYPRDVVAHMHVSWLDPAKTRRTTVVGTRRMLVYDDLNTDARLTVHDKGAEPLEPAGDGVRRYRLRDDAVHVPVLSPAEPLSLELRHFLDCVRTGARPRTDGWNGARVVAVLEAADASLRAGGATVPVPPVAGPVDAAGTPGRRPQPDGLHPDGPHPDLTTAAH